jgi:two-component system chemotaxis response regulator CheY
LKILIVDDSPTTRSFLKVILNLESMDLLEAENGERALLIAQLVTLDLVIADVNMPRLDGIGLVQKLRASPESRLRRLPVVLLTADRSEELQRRGLEAGATAFARKPILPAELSAIVKGIGKRLALDESLSRTSGRRGPA